ncbi:oligosaccharide repeat unit polymerase [Amylibacter sp.]|nr:oligosaccharide repeat unit polymerase [Amylibacter sp.]
MKFILIILIFTNFFVIYKTVKSKDFMAKPHYTLFVTGYAFYMLLFPFLYVMDMIPFVYSETKITISLLISTFGLMIFYLSYQLILVPTRTITFGRPFNKGLSDFGMGYSAIPIFIILMIPLIIFKPSYINFGVLIVVIMMLAMSPKYKKTNKFFLYLTLIFVLIFVSATSGGRRDLLVSMMIWYALFVNINRSSTMNDFKKSLLVFVITFAGMIYITLARTFGDNLDLSSDLIRVLQTYQGVIGSLLVLADFAIAYDNYIQIINNTAADGFLGFQSFYRLFLIPIPREILVNKPMDVQQLIVSAGYARNNYAGGTSQSTTLIGEFYWNYGIIAVMFGMSMFGFFIRFMDNLFYKRSPLKIVIALSMLPFSFLVWRGAFSTTLIYCLLTTVVCILLLIILNITKRTNQ